VQVNVKEQRHVEVPNGQTCFFQSLSKGCVFRRLTGIDMAARLHPDTKNAMPMKNDPSRRDHKG
jgi:hypothetical protein